MGVPAAMVADSGTWHHGLMARWWAEFVPAEPAELDYFRGAIRKFGEPALDLGCGAGRILIPMLAEGFDIDGSDVSADMIAEGSRAGSEEWLFARLTVEPTHELDLARKYRTIYMCGVFGIGGRRDHDREALRRILPAPGAGRHTRDRKPLVSIWRMETTNNGPDGCPDIGKRSHGSGRLKASGAKPPTATRSRC